jgi:hypothetical protein
VADEVELQPHCLKEYIHPAKTAKRNKLDSPTHGSYIYVDGFIGAAVESRDGTLLLGGMTPGILGGIHSVFRHLLPSQTGHIGDKDPISVQKLHERELLRFVDHDAKQVRISEAKPAAIIQEIRPILKKRWV